MEDSPELPLDVLDSILIGFNLKELACLKGVSPSWYTYISSTRFHFNHLKYNNDRNDNNAVGDRRIFIPVIDPRTFSNYAVHDSFFNIDDSHLLGSSNGLVCISPSDTQVVVANPLTREVRKLENLPIPYRESFCWGFGYDSSTDDYKIVVGYRKGKNQTCFQVLSLKINVWKVIGEVNYSFFGRAGVLCNGALHWLMDDMKKKKNHIILSFDLSKEEFKEIPQPNDPSYIFTYRTYIGIIQDCLCIFNRYNNHYPIMESKNYDVFPLWVMRNYNVKESWELLPYKPDMKNDTAHSLRNLRNYSRVKKSMFHDVICSSNTGEYFGAHLYVESVVSPYVNGKPKRKRRAKGNQRKVKLIKGETSSAGA